MRILGIDPGLAIVGFGFVDKEGHKLTPVQYGCIQTEQDIRLRKNACCMSMKAWVSSLININLML